MLFSLLDFVYTDSGIRSKKVTYYRLVIAAVLALPAYYTFFYSWTRYFTPYGILQRPNIYASPFGFTDSDIHKLYPVTRPWLRVQDTAADPMRPLYWYLHLLIMIPRKALVFGSADGWVDSILFNIEACLIVAAAAILVGALCVPFRQDLG